jgi:hypothetical protein
MAGTYLTFCFASLHPSSTTFVLPRRATRERHALLIQIVSRARTPPFVSLHDIALRGHKGMMYFLMSFFSHLFFQLKIQVGGKF